jgi:glucose-1-phosphate thymidylyltransferase
MESAMKGIVLAGGLGTRLNPITLAISKHLVPVYDKPLVYYSISTLMMAGIREILIISTPIHLPLFQRLLGDGESWGVKFNYATQPTPAGIAQAFLIAEAFLRNSSVALILGDNIFFGHGLGELFAKAAGRKAGATVFAYQVVDPERFGIIEFDSNGRALSIEEKPVHPTSKWAVTGLYFYDQQVVNFARQLTPSARSELEVADLINLYLQRGQLAAEQLGPGVAWFDTGTPESLLEAAEFVRSLEKSQGLKIACPEEVAYRRGFIDRQDLLRLGKKQSESMYGKYLVRVAEEEKRSP